MRTLVKAIKAILAPAPKAIPVVAAPAASTPSFTEQLSLLRAYDSHHIATLEKELAALRKENRNLTRANKRTTARLEEEAQALDTMISVANSRREEVAKAKQAAADAITIANNHAGEVAELQSALEWEKRMTEEASNLAIEGLRLLDIADIRGRILGNLYASAKARISSKFALPVVTTEVTEQEILYLALRQVEIDAEVEVALTPAGRKVVGFAKGAREGAYHCRQCRKVEARRGHRHGTSTPSPRERYHYLNR